MTTTLSSPISERLAGLRAAMKRHGLTHYVVPTADPHQSEYVPAWWRRREWVSGFTGSAGTAVVGLEGAWLWTDSRYYLQAEKELSGTGYELMRSGAPGVPQIGEWLADTVGPGGVLGFDPRTVSLDQERAWKKALDRKGSQVRHVDDNLVDSIWGQRPAVALDPLLVHPESFSGEAPAKKIERVQESLKKADCDALVVTMLDAVAWLFDVRGTDVGFNPVAVAQALVTKDGATLFVDERKITPELRKHLPASVKVQPYEAFGPALEALGSRGARVWIETASATSWIASRLEGAKLHEARSPITDLKARKNERELQGARDAHVRDGVAMVRFLSWLDATWRTRRISEIEAATELERLRSEGEHYRGLSFETISAYGDHGAIIHYRPAEEGDRVIGGDSLYVLDSGAQYLDGTTDITRTICLGTPTAEQVDQFTRVLKGHVAIARVTFPHGTTGKQIDALARLPLWEIGRNFGHGTGHGVGSYLNVHEGPQRIAHKGEDVALEPGMLLSNEPGYYVPGSHGIRIETIVAVIERPDLTPKAKDGDAEKPEAFLGFETLTCCPIDLRLVDASALRPEERAWLNEHHAWVRKTLSPRVDATTRTWLENATRAI